MTIDYDKTEDILSVVLDSEIDHHSAAVMREAVDGEIAEKQPEFVYLNFENVVFMDSSGIGFILGRYKNVRSYGGNLKVINPGSNIKKLIRLSGIEKLGVLGK